MMARFEIEQGGKRFEVEAPDIDRAMAAVPLSEKKAEVSQGGGFGANIADLFKSIPRGLVRGAVDTMTLPGQAEAGMMGMEGVPGPEKVMGGVERNITGEMHKPTTLGGRIGAGLGEAATNPASYLGPGGFVVKGVGALGSVVGGEAAGSLTEGTKAEPYARLIGSVAGGHMPRSVPRAVTPLPISPERQALVNTLRHESIEPTAGDVSGRHSLRYAESHLGEAPGSGGAFERVKGESNDAFTRAALARIGENADRATPDVIDRAHVRIGRQFDNLAARNDAQMDRQYVQDLLDAQRDYDHLFVDPARRPIVEHEIDQQLNLLARSPIMDGETYKAQRSRIERARRSHVKDPELNEFLASVRQAMDDLMERNIAANNPRDLGAWREVRNQYRNLLVLDQVAVGGGEAAAEGIVSPARLRQATVSKHGRTNYARGRGDFADLARAGNAIMSPMPQSGTAPRQLLSNITAGLGGVAGSAFGGPAGIAPGAIAAGASPGLTGRALMSPAIQAYLKNQLLTGHLNNLEPAQYQVIRSLLGELGRQSQ